MIVYYSNKIMVGWEILYIIIINSLCMWIYMASWLKDGEREKQ